MIYAIGDIHGMRNKIISLYDKILFDAKDEKSTIVFLGDYVDRGLESKETLDFLLSLKDSDQINHIFLKGNHEQMMVDFYYRNMSDHVYLLNGGRETLYSFYCVTAEDFYNPNEMVHPYIQWMKDLPFIHRIGNYVFVHGGYDTRKSFDEQEEDVVLWKRVSPYCEFNEYVNCEYIIVHGHTPKTEPFIAPNEINVDTGSCFDDGKLTAVCLPENYNADLPLLEQIRFLTA